MGGKIRTEIKLVHWDNSTANIHLHSPKLHLMFSDDNTLYIKRIHILIPETKTDSENSKEIAYKLQKTPH